MSFANMSPADRMKASGLIGLIVVILFVVVHVVLGAVAPKKQVNAAADNTAQGGVAAPPAPVSGPSPTGSPTADSGFPTEKIVGAKGAGLAHSMAMDITDPFVPIRDPRDKPGAPVGAVRPQEPRVEMRPVGNVPPASVSYGVGPVLPFPGAPGAGTNPGLAGTFGQSGIIAARPEPEIKVIGLVDGDPPIATMQVAGRVTLAHRGDALATGYRVVDISQDGVVIRCGKERKTLRAGGIMNEARTESK